MAVEKKYDPHVVIVWTSDTTVAVKEYPYKEDAEEKYHQLTETHAQKVVLAQVVRVHGEG